MSKELKPCPFCGAEVEIEKYHFGMEVTVIMDATNLESDAKNVVRNHFIRKTIQYFGLRMKQ